VIIAILMAVAIPAFLGQRQKAQDSAAKSALRNGMTAMETYFVDNQTYVGADDAGMPAVESTLTWGDLPADGDSKTIHVSDQTTSNYKLECKSTSGTTFTATRDGGVQ
jgi:type IV pilus assembly protein PilA